MQRGTSQRMLSNGHPVSFARTNTHAAVPPGVTRFPEAEGHRTE